MRKTTQFGEKEIPDPNAAEYEKIYSGDFVSVQRLLSPFGLSVLTKVLLSNGDMDRQCLVDATFNPEFGWSIFEGYFKIPSINFTIIAWTWSPITGKPINFTRTEKISKISLD